MKLAYCHTDWNTQLHRNRYQPRLLYLVLKRLCLGKESYLSLLRITSEVELLLLYNQRHNILFLSVVLWHTNCPRTWRQYYNRSPTNPDENYNPLIAILQYTDPLPLPTEDIVDLLNLCLTSGYFQYNSKHYKQLHGTATGSPVSVVVAEIVMQHRGKSSFDFPTNDTTLVTLRWRYFHRRTTRRNRRIPPPP